MFRRMGAALSAACVVAVAARRASEHRNGCGIAHSEAALPPVGGNAGIHIWGTPANDAVLLLGTRLGGECPSRECPSDIAWGAGAGCVVTQTGALVGFRVASDSVESLPSASARHVAMDEENTMFYTTTAGKLLRWSPFGANRVTVAELLPGRTVTRVACGSAHCLAIDDEGRAYSWATHKGGARMGALGRPTPQEGGTAQHDDAHTTSITPEEMPGLVILPGGARAVECAAGDRHRCVYVSMHGCMQGSRRICVCTVQHK